jgi:hypothetical protein
MRASTLGEDWDTTHCDAKRQPVYIEEPSSAIQCYSNTQLAPDTMCYSLYLGDIGHYIDKVSTALVFTETLSRYDLVLTSQHLAGDELMCASTDVPRG